MRLELESMDRQSGRTSLYKEACTNDDVIVAELPYSFKPFPLLPNLIPLCFLKGDLVNTHFLHCGWGYDGHSFSISGTLLGYECETGLFSSLGVPKGEISVSVMHVPLFSSLLKMN